MSIHSALLTAAFRIAIDPLARHLASVLISSLWQGIALILTVGLCLRSLPGTTARLRFIVWTLVFTILAALPALNALTGIRAPTRLISSLAVQLDPRWSYGLAGLWLAAVVARAALLAFQTFKLRSLWNSAIPVRAERLAGLPLGGVQLCTSAQLDRPGVIGFFSPRILIPVWLIDQLTPGELHQIVLHEMEHLRRRDDWMNLLQKTVLVFFPLNPALVWIDRRLGTERELACDDGVLSRTHAPRAYATCLTNLAERRLVQRRSGRFAALVLGAVGAIRRSEFSRRIESILGFASRSTLHPAYARGSVVMLAAGLFGAALALARAPQLVTFSAAQTQPVAAVLPSTPVVGEEHQPGQASFKSVVFHPAQPIAANPSVSRLAKQRVKPRRSAVVVSISADKIKSKKISPNRRWMVLTSWQQNTPQPVFVTLPDGRIFLATYAVDPNANSVRAGWLIIQL